MKIGDRVNLKAIVRLDIDEGSYAVEIPSYPARHQIRSSRKLKPCAELELAGEVVMLPDEGLVMVQLDNRAGRLTVRADTIAALDRPKTHPKLFDRSRR